MTSYMHVLLLLNSLLESWDTLVVALSDPPSRKTHSVDSFLCEEATWKERGITDNLKLIVLSTIVEVRDMVDVRDVASRRGDLNLSPE